MSCPYLKEVTMVFCRAYPVKKPVPLDQVTTASTCEGGFEGCPLFQEALAQARKALAGEESHPAAASEKGATS